MGNLLRVWRETLHVHRQKASKPSANKSQLGLARNFKVDHKWLKEAITTRSLLQLSLSCSLQFCISRWYVRLCNHGIFAQHSSPLLKEPLHNQMDNPEYLSQTPCRREVSLCFRPPHKCPTVRHLFRHTVFSNSNLNKAIFVVADAM